VAARLDSWLDGRLIMGDAQAIVLSGWGRGRNEVMSELAGVGDCREAACSASDRTV